MTPSPQSPVTARYASFSRAALKALSASGVRLAEMLLAAVPRDVRDSAVSRSGRSIQFVPNPATREVFLAAIESTGDLFAALTPDTPAPDTRALEQADVDFVKMAQAYGEWDEAGLEPELVLGPVNAGLEFWRKLYSALRAWQDANDPQSRNRLQSHPGGDGLWILESVERRYGEILDGELRALPGTRIGPAPGGLSGRSGLIWKIAVLPAADKPPGSAGGTGAGEDRNHPAIGLYFTLQARRIFRKKTPVDTDGFTRLGVLLRFPGERGAFVPRGNFGPVNGQVYLYGYETQDGGDSSGARPPVWG